MTKLEKFQDEEMAEARRAVVRAACAVVDSFEKAGDPSWSMTCKISYWPLRDLRDATNEAADTLERHTRQNEAVIAVQLSQEAATPQKGKK